MKNIITLLMLVCISTFSITNLFSQGMNKESKHEVRLSFIGDDGMNIDNKIYGNFQTRIFDPTIEYLYKISDKNYYFKAKLSGAYIPKYTIAERLGGISNSNLGRFEVFTGIEKQHKKKNLGFFIAGGIKYSDAVVNADLNGDIIEHITVKFSERQIGFQSHFGLTLKIAKNVYLFWNSNQELVYINRESNYYFAPSNEEPCCAGYDDWFGRINLLDGIGIDYKF